MYISNKDWKNYIDRLSALDKHAGDEMLAWIQKNYFTDTKALIDYAYALVQKYGEGSAALSAEMYDAVAAMQSRFYDPAVAAPPPEYGEVAKTVNGILKHSQNPDSVANGVSRLVKRTGADTTLNNALRDGAEFAWVPNGDTCAFCIALASRGWQKASKNALKNGHAEHIHANCDCTYAIRFDKDTDVEGYDPQVYEDMYYGAEGNTPNELINSLRRMHYEQNRDAILAQKREAYAEREKSKPGKRYPVTQSQIDDIIDNELKGYEIIERPVYNPRLRSQGKTTAELYPWGEVKRIKKIEVGPQSRDTKECLIDTIIHEQLEAKILLESGNSDFYKQLNEMSDDDRHIYINKTIKEYFEEKGWDYGLV